MEVVLSNGFCELAQKEMEAIDGGAGWDDLGFLVVTSCGAVIGGVVGGAIFGAGYILIG